MASVLAGSFRLANLPELLLHYRIHPDSVGVAQRARLRNVARVVREARSRRGLPEPDGLEGALPRAGSSDEARWIVRTAREHGFVRTARKHAWSIWRAEPWSRASGRLLRLAWLGA